MHMAVGAYQYHLPEDLIAQFPVRRGSSRLLHLPARGRIRHLQFEQVAQLLNPGDLLVCNNTRVMPARLRAFKKKGGGRVEILVDRCQGQHAWAWMRFSGRMAIGSELVLPERKSEHVQGQIRVLERENRWFRLEFSPPLTAEDWLWSLGEVPLPPYIRRTAKEQDREDYQTVYAERKGAVAAPTAGLHFHEKLLKHLTEKGVRVAFLTLHVGVGTFQPVQVERLEEHRMHPERVEISPELVAAVGKTRSNGGRVVAVGTTSARALESAIEAGELRPIHGETSLFIYPGYPFRCVDALISNFHQPGSTPLMLVSALAGRARVLAAYRQAVRHRYRFLSYGDAMFIERRQGTS